MQIGNGKSCFLWEDLWEQEILRQKFPELFSFAKDKLLVSADCFAQDHLHNLFHLLLSQHAHAQLSMLQNMVDEVVVNEDNDKWSYIWDSDRFSVKKTYKHLRGHQVTHQAFRWLWKCSCQNKHKVFFWLVLIDRVSTRELLKRKNMVLQDYTCVLCNGAIEESQTHLFLQCPFAMQCWGSINLQVQQHLDPFQNLQSFKDQLSEPFFHGSYSPNGLDNLEVQE